MSTRKESLSWSAAMDRLKFQHRKCSTFTPQEIKKYYCVCNRPESAHLKKNTLTHLIEPWTWKKHTETISTEDYGILPQSSSPYLRCDVETDLDQLCLVLLGVWGMHVPSLILRMMSNASSTVGIKLERELLQGISDAAVASDACIITSCYKEDTISQLIGEVIYKSRVKNPEITFRAIGVGKWGNIRDRPSSKESDKDHSTHYDRSGQYTLEPNLTHYIFFDDGTHDSIDTGEFASKLAGTIALGASRRIPLINVLVGGDLNALKLLFNDLKNHIPVVIVDQSGLLANTMCKHLKSSENLFKQTKNRNSEEDDVDENGHDIDDEEDTYILSLSVEKTTLKDIFRKFGKDIRSAVFKDVRKLYSTLRQQEYAAMGKKLPAGELLNLEEERALAKYLFYFGSCLTLPYRDQTHIFDHNSPDSFQNKIYEALIQVQKDLSSIPNKHGMMADDQMRLALRWNIVDISDGPLHNKATDWKDTKKLGLNRNLLLDALNKNLLVFVSNFVKLDIDFTLLFIPIADLKENRAGLRWKCYLKQLYAEKMRKNTSSLYLLDTVNKKLPFKEEKHLNSLLEALVGDFMEPIYMSSSSSTKLSQVVPEKTAEKTDDEYYHQSATNEQNVQTKTDDEYIYRDLFLWCVLTHRLEMAKIFLGQMKTRICSALIASKILRSLSQYAPDHDSRDKLHSEADDFEMYAIECIRCSYFYDREQACELIIRRIKLYGNVTCLQMAIAADDKKFLYEDACNALLTNIWFDKNDPVHERVHLVVNLLTMGISQFFISIYEKHYDKRETTRSEAYAITKPTNKRPLAKNGINYTDDYQTEESILKHFSHFHNRPIVKYCYTCFGYFLFLLFFSYYMLYAFDPPSEDTPSIHWTEILTIIFVTTMLFEEIRQLWFQDNRSLKSKLLTYFDWNNRSSNICLVLPAYLLFYIGLILRFTLYDPETFSSARIVMAYDLELWFIRSILFIGIVPSLGPKLVMIRKMTNDLLFFVFLIMVVIFGYGVTSRAMTAYGTFAFDGRQFFLNVIYPVYYFVLGSFDSERSNLEATPDASTTIATQVMFAFHMLFVNILLVNLLIALFSFTIDNVQEQANYIWAYDRCALIRDYYARPALFPPFTFFISIAYFCRWCWRKYYANEKAARRFKMIPSDDNVDNAWSEFERYSTNDYVRRLLDAQAVTTSDIISTDVASKVSPTNRNDLTRFKGDIDQLSDGLLRTRIETSEQLLSIESSVENLNDRVNRIDTRLDRVMDSLDWMMTAMARVKMSTTDPPVSKQNTKTLDAAQDNQRVGKRNSVATSQQSKQVASTVPHTHIIIDDQANDEKDA